MGEGMSDRRLNETAFGEGDGSWPVMVPLPDIVSEWPEASVVVGYENGEVTVTPLRTAEVEKGLTESEGE